MSDPAYCDSWFWKKRKPVDILTESQARKRHEKREEYTVAIGGFDQPSAMVEVVNRMVAVTFFDDLLRQRNLLKFQEKEPNRLFLSMAVCRRYCPATPAMVARLEAGRKNPKQPWGQFLAEVDRVIEGTSLSFEQDDKVLRIREHFAEPYALERTALRWDVSGHWAPYPAFGEYGYLLQRDRELPWGPGLDEDWETAPGGP